MGPGLARAMDAGSLPRDRPGRARHHPGIPLSGVCWSFRVSLGYVELIDRSLYLNHYYWVVLTVAVMPFLPLHAILSLDAFRGRVPRPGHFPALVVWMLRFQVGMVYVFAGLAKLNGDWLFRAEPLSTWLPARSEMWLIGSLLTLPVTAYFLAWAGVLFDLTIVGWLSCRPTRPYAYGVLVVFHALTWLMFPSIGLFPLLMSLSRPCLLRSGLAGALPPLRLESDVSERPEA